MSEGNTPKEEGYDPRTGTFRATYDPGGSRSLNTTLIRAVSILDNTPPEELTPLQDHIDTDALTALFEPLSETTPRDSGVIEFEFNGYRVRIYASNKIVVERLDGEAERSKNILFLTSDGEVADEQACTEILMDEYRAQRSILSIVFDRPVEDQLELWQNHIRPSPASVTIIGMGEVSSAAEGSITEGETIGTIHAVSDPSNLSKLGVLITDRLQEASTADTELAVCVQSLEDLLDHVETEQAIKFLTILTGQIRNQDALAHYHLDPGQVDEDTLGILNVLFDETVDRTGDHDSASAT